MAKNYDIDMGFDSLDPSEVLYQHPSRQSRRSDSQQHTAKSEHSQSSVEDNIDDKELNRKRRSPHQDREREQFKEHRNPIIRFFTDERLRVFLGTTLLLACVFVIIAFFSHLKYGALDQSIALNSTQSEMAANPEEVKNAAGGFGAVLSQVFMCDSLGLGSLVFIFYFWFLAIALLGFKKCNFWSLTFKTLLLSITISIVFGLVFYTSPSVFKWGGLHGYFINKFLIDHASVMGAILVSCVLITAVACVYLNELRRLWLKWKETTNRIELQEEIRLERKRKAQELDDVTNEKVDSAEKTNYSESVSLEVPITDASDSSFDSNVDQENLSLVKLNDKENANVQETNDIDNIFNEDDSQDYRPSFINKKVPQESENKELGFTIQKEDQFEAKKTEPQKGFSFTTNDSVDETHLASESKPNFVFENEDKEEIHDIVNEHDVATEELGSGFSITVPEIEVADGLDIEKEDEDSTSDNNKTAYELFGPFDHRAELSHYSFPSIDLLAERETGPVVDMEEQQANKERIVKTLSDYKIGISKIEATVGPTVTLYEIVPAEGVRISQIKRLEDDIALSLSALGIRITAPIPGKGTVGIEVPNSSPCTVSMRSVITSRKYQESKMALPMAMGATISNEIFIADLTKMPHLLVAGATGMGKSVGLNAILASLLYKKHPSELKFVLIDPKMVEFSLYSKLERHYLAKLPDEEDAIITDPSKVIQTLNSLCVEMDDRYALLRKANVRSIEEYNKKFTERRLSPANGHKYLPYIVVVVDEFADLIMTAGKEVETPIARIAQKARAVGMHMIIATQRPSTNVITGIIKANFPGRVAFRVSQMVDSKTILDRTGANQLIGRGDMLFSHNGSLERVQCAFISTEEVEAITQSIDNQAGYEHAYFLPEVPSESIETQGGSAGASTERDPMFDEAARFIVQRQVGSTSLLQRKFNIGYNRAGRLMDQMEAAGIIGPVNGSKPRNILVDSISLEQILQQS